MKLYAIAPHFSKIEVGYLGVWFSYQTPIAYNYAGETVVRENSWGTATTGKHINQVNADKKARVAGEVFDLQLREIEARINAGLEEA